MTALFQLSAEYRQISDKLHDLDLDETTIADTLEGVGGELQEKAINVAKFFRNVESDAEQIEAAAKQMLERAKAMRKKADSLKRYLHTNMEKAGITPTMVANPHKDGELIAVITHDQASQLLAAKGYDVEFTRNFGMVNQSESCPCTDAEWEDALIEADKAFPA